MIDVYFLFLTESVFCVCDMYVFDGKEKKRISGLFNLLQIVGLGIDIEK